MAVNRIHWCGRDQGYFMNRHTIGPLYGDQGHCWATAVIRDTAGPLVWRSGTLWQSGTLWRSGTLLDHLCGDHGHCWATCVAIRNTAGQLR
ncbi:unnamed protein product [Staurois parvus]|uniref:Uncharacterized protein n=1 Tax=Staurois parvus TaxID=386267 RepID=A0ABN9ENI9_9NEOB|nr:unnamed protein product [Staurois parvus]